MKVNYRMVAQVADRLGQETTVPTRELVALLQFAMSMLAHVACRGQRRPIEDYRAVFGGENGVFNGILEELEWEDSVYLRFDEEEDEEGCA